MKRITKIIRAVLSAALIAAVVFSLAGCGEINKNEIIGSWKCRSINGKSPAEYAKRIGATEEGVMMTFEITEDRARLKGAGGSEFYSYELRSNGFEAMKNDKIVMSVEYNKKEKTLSFSSTEPTGEAVCVFEKTEPEKNSAGSDEEDDEEEEDDDDDDE